MPRLLDHRKLPWIALLAVLSVVGGVAVLADEVLEGETQGFDMAVLMALRTPGNPADPIGPAWFEEAARDVTSLGSFTILFLLVALVSAVLALGGKTRNALFLIVSSASGALVSTLLKLLFDRPRPELTGLARVFTASFPSGHALASAVVYLTMGVFAARAAATSTMATFLMGSAVFLTVLVGLSRIYLGVHYPTDVIAGWLIGTGWALACWLAVEWGLGRRSGG